MSALRLSVAAVLALPVLPALAQVPDPDVAALVPSIVAPYAPTFAAMGVWALLMLVLAWLSSSRPPRARSDSGHPVAQYDDPAYRRSRAHLNAVETSGPFLAAAVAAVLAGGPAFWVNLLAVLFVAARIGMAVVHIMTENQTLRSAFFAGAMACVAALALLAIVGAIAP